jgi:hypothetical protein
MPDDNATNQNKDIEPEEPKKARTVFASGGLFVISAVAVALLVCLSLIAFYKVGEKSFRIRETTLAIVDGDATLFISGSIDYGNGFGDGKVAEFAFEFRVNPERWFPLPVVATSGDEQFSTQQPNQEQPDTDQENPN